MEDDPMAADEGGHRDRHGSALATYGPKKRKVAVSSGMTASLGTEYDAGSKVIPSEAVQKEPKAEVPDNRTSVKK